MTTWVLRFIIIANIFTSPGAQALSTSQCLTVLQDSKEFIYTRTAVLKAVSKKSVLWKIATHPYLQKALFVTSFIQLAGTTAGLLASPMPVVYFPPLGLELNPDEFHVIQTQGIDSAPGRQIVLNKMATIKKLRFYNKIQKIYWGVIFAGLVYFPSEDLWMKSEIQEQQATHNGDVVMQQLSDEIAALPPPQIKSREEIWFEETVQLYTQHYGHPPSPEEQQIIRARIHKKINEPAN